jgi:hypothetical protein
LRGNLNQAQLDILFLKAIEFLQNQAYEATSEGQQERTLTKNQIGPALRKFALSLGIPQLVVRHDGDSPVRPLLRHGMTFLPDAQISLGSQKVLAVEVKILRESDPSGSLSKALGQTFMYRSLGYEISLGMIFDFRRKAHADLHDSLSKVGSTSERIKVLLFNPTLNPR